MRKVLLLLAVSSSAWAAPITIIRDMTPGMEIPPPDTTGGDPFGTANAVFDPDMMTLEATLMWRDMTSTVVAAHIHRFTPPAMAGGIVVGFFMGVQFDTTDSFTTTTPIDLTADQVSTLLAGLGDGTLYFNVHTVQNPPGEIRGDIGVVPEPGSVALLLGGLGGLALMRLRRRAS